MDLTTVVDAAADPTGTASPSAAAAAAPPAPPAPPAIPGSAVDPTAAAAVVSHAWDDQARWSAVANHLRDGISRWRLTAAVAGVLGLFLTVLASTLLADPQHSLRTVLNTVGVLLLALVPYVRQNLLKPERVAQWTRARNVSELLKEAIYRHLMGALNLGPASDGSPAPDPAHPATLVRRSRAVQQAAVELAGLCAGITVPPHSPRKTQMGLKDYLADRVDGQVKYYKKAGEKAGLKARWLRGSELGLGALAVVLGWLSGQESPPEVLATAVSGMGTFTALVPWLTLVAGAAAAVTAHMAAGRFEDLANKYLTTQNLLTSIQDDWLVSPDHESTAQVGQLVDNIERAISTETEAWVADWTKAQAAG